MTQMEGGGKQAMMQVDGAQGMRYFPPAMPIARPVAAWFDWCASPTQ